MVTTFIYLFAFILVLSLVVIVHEGGHFWMARRCGVQVVEFSVGFGKELFGWTDKKGTRWKVCALPLGGYVKMLGDEDAASAKSSESKVAPEMVPYTFMAQKLWKRALIIFAGPAMNYVFAIFLFTGILWACGEVVLSLVIGEIEVGSAAEKAGLLAGDEIVQMNDKVIQQFSDVQRAIRLTEYGKPIVIRFKRNGEELETTAHLSMVKETGLPHLGIKSDVKTVVINDDIGLLQAFVTSVNDVFKMTVDTLYYLGQIITAGRSAKDMRGPLGIAEASGDAFQGGWLSLIVFIGQISVAIGFMNLLPIPLLDGGHLFFYAIEAVRRKPMAEKTQNVFLWAGVSFLFALLAYTMFLDIPRIWMRVMG